jgi:hypothetical protein
MYFVGLDLGQKRDHSAVAVVERVDRRWAFQGITVEKLLVRYAERMPIGTPYPKVVERVRQIVQSEELAGNCALAVDATGVGAPVVDMLRAARLGCELTAVTITGGERGTTRSGTGSNGSVPKKDLIAEVQVLLECGRLKIGKVREGGRLLRELGEMKTSVSGAGRARMGADGYGEHDDLAIALALACWRAKRRVSNGERTRRLPGI